MARDIGSVRLDSSLPGAHWGQAFGDALALLRCDAGTHIATLTTMAGDVTRQWADPLEALREISSLALRHPAKSVWVGYLSYDLGRLFEQIPSIASDDLSLPLFCFTLHDRDEDPATERSSGFKGSGAPLDCNFTRDAYLAAVRRCKDYIAAGDIFQVNLSQRFTAGLSGRPGEIYERLLRRTPAWYGALLQYADHALICNSPETFLRVTPRPDSSRTVTTRPIKGTRPRAPGMEEQLRASAKDQAELNMIIDLERNDLGRVCEIGSVKVTQPRVIEVHPTVYHGVATVEGTLRPDVTFLDLLRATFPGGSVTGAPKIRAMQIIEELEPTRRGPYCGAIGYLSCDGHIEFNIAIRTMIVKDGLVHIPVGGGIVADSKPEEEYEETLVKARAMFDALGLEISRL